jgi:TetR/AcrR family hemagglutinin/protease transcriptional regulator
LNSSAKGPRTRLAPELRREQFLECALKVFAEHGIARGTQSQVAKRAGVSVSAVYSYFRTREDLVYATLSKVDSFVSEVFAASLAGKRSSHDELVDLAYKSMRRPETNLNIPRYGWIGVLAWKAHFGRRT